MKKQKDSEITSDPVIADRVTLSRIRHLRLVHDEMDVLKLEYDQMADRVKNFMGDDQILIAPGGEEIATLKPQEGRRTVDIDLLEKNYPEAYEACVNKNGEVRPFVLKKGYTPINI